MIARRLRYDSAGFSPQAVFSAGLWPRTSFTDIVAVPLFLLADIRRPGVSPNTARRSPGALGSPNETSKIAFPLIVRQRLRLPLIEAEASTASADTSTDGRCSELVSPDPRGSTLR